MSPVSDIFLVVSEGLTVLINASSYHNDLGHICEYVVKCLGSCPYGWRAVVIQN